MLNNNSLNLQAGESKLTLTYLTQVFIMIFYRETPHQLQKKRLVIFFLY